MNKKSRISPEEKAQFRRAMQSNPPAAHGDHELQAHRSDCHPPFENDDTPFTETITTHYRSEEQLYFAKPGPQHKLLKKLKSGSLGYQSTLDLHGHTLSEAAHLLHQHLQQCRSSHSKISLIIHGKGLQSNPERPLLKNAVAGWLQQDSRVLAFCSAQGKDGGTGAVYVLLKQQD